MEYVVIDLEFNQPFDFPTGRKTVLVPECPFEVIQIGAVKMNDAFEITDARDFLAKPSVYKRIHPFVRRITGLDSAVFSKQPSFPETYQEFAEFLSGGEYVFCVWGSGDIKTLFENIKYYNLENALTDKYIDVQQLASRKLETPPGTTAGLKTAVESFNIETDEDFHNALNDARYTAKVFQLVHSEDMAVQSYVPSEKNEPDFSRLYKAMEKEFGHKLGKRERRLVRSIYLLGRDKKYN